LCDKICHWPTTGQWFSSGTLVSSANKTDRHDISEILLKESGVKHNKTKTYYYKGDNWYILCCTREIILSWSASRTDTPLTVNKIWPSFIPALDAGLSTIIKIIHLEAGLSTITVMLFSFPIFQYWAYLMKVIPETIWHLPCYHMTSTLLSYDIYLVIIWHLPCYHMTSFIPALDAGLSTIIKIIHLEAGLSTIIK
jgi:hypothetical protein